MKGNDILATTAIALGTGQMLVHGVDVFRTGDVSSYNLPSVFIGVAASLLWTLYQFKKDGMNYSVVYSGFGLAIQLYILQRLLLLRRQKATSKHNQ
jgi:hypothetical protein